MTTLQHLRRLTFQGLLKIPFQNIDQYSFADYLNRQCTHPPADGFCIACEKAGLSCSPDDPSFCLKLISHGAHSSDFIAAASTAATIDTAQWHNEPVAFVYENPSRAYEGLYYGDIMYDGYAKRPARQWSWIHGPLDPRTFPSDFEGHLKYGEFIISAIETFRLANVYVTNVVKCGMINPKAIGQEGNFKPTTRYDPGCVHECINTVLKAEFDILQPRVVFAMGSAVDAHLRAHFPHPDFTLQELPHPAAHIRKEHFKALNFWFILQTLRDQKIIIEQDEMERLLDVFFTGFKQQQ